MDKKSIFSKISSYSVGAIASGLLLIAPVSAFAEEGTTETTQEEAEGEKNCGGEKDCGGEKGCSGEGSCGGEKGCGGE
jgi:hypothetical protein